MTQDRIQLFSFLRFPRCAWGVSSIYNFIAVQRSASICHSRANFSSFSMNFSTRLRTKYANSKEISFVQLLDIFQLLGGVSQYEIRLGFSYFIPL